MASRRRISKAQIQSKVRQAQSKLRQAAQKVDRELRKAQRDFNTAVNNYNREARAHNARVRANQRKLKQELSRLASRPVTTRYTTLRASVQTVHQAYVHYEADVGADSPVHAEFLDLAERESANSAAVLNALLDEEQEPQDFDGLQQTGITDELRSISTDFEARWKGALFSLNPQNPDAARHFCTSTREIYAEMLELKAPDSDVLAATPGCPKTHEGRPTRRAKIHHVLAKKGLDVTSLEDFVEQDIENIVELFKVFNPATHGPAGRYDLHRLRAIKTRAEDGLLFLARVVS